VKIYEVYEYKGQIMAKDEEQALELLKDWDNLGERPPTQASIRLEKIDELEFRR